MDEIFLKMNIAIKKKKLDPMDLRLMTNAKTRVHEVNKKPSFFGSEKFETSTVKNLVFTKTTAATTTKKTTPTTPTPPPIQAIVAEDEEEDDDILQTEIDKVRCCQPDMGINSEFYPLKKQFFF